MKVIEDLEMEDWLENLSSQSDCFNWDDANEHKNHKHGVSRQQIESLFFDGAFRWGRIVEPICDEPRFAMLGRDGNGRLLTLIFTRRGERIRPISCRPMRREEREIYEENAA